MAASPGAPLKVIDLTHYIAGPYCTKLLADFGADVIKLEKPGDGDDARRLGPFPDGVPHPEKSGIFFVLNLNKRGITLDIAKAGGAGILKEMVREADVLVENFAPRVLPSLGLDYETLAAINPRLVMTSISNFGQTGPYRDYHASDLILYALSGVMNIVGTQGREPLKQGLHQAQYLGGVVAATGTLAAVRHARRTGEGQHVDVSLLETLMRVIFPSFAGYAYHGSVEQRIPPGMAGLINSSPMPVKDGFILPASAGLTDWETVSNFFGIPELKDPKFMTADGRAKHFRELYEALLPELSKWDKYELSKAAQDWRLTLGPVQTAKDLIDCPQLAVRDFFQTIDHPVLGTVKHPGMVPAASEMPRAARLPAPLLGQHNEEIYCGLLGYTKADLISLRQGGVI